MPHLNFLKSFADITVRGTSPQKPLPTVTWSVHQSKYAQASATRFAARQPKALQERSGPPFPTQRLKRSPNRLQELKAKHFNSASLFQLYIQQGDYAPVLLLMFAARVQEYIREHLGHWPTPTERPPHSHGWLCSFRNLWTNPDPEEAL